MSDMQTVKIQITKTNSIEIPLIIFLLTQFFNENPTLLDTEGIFRVNGDKKVIDDIKVHLLLGNYKILDECRQHPHIIANLLKEIIRSFKEPVIPFEKYHELSNMQLKEVH